jgi:hypothetical protein
MFKDFCQSGAGGTARFSKPSAQAAQASRSSIEKFSGQYELPTHFLPGLMRPEEASRSNLAGKLTMGKTIPKRQALQISKGIAR